MKTAKEIAREHSALRVCLEYNGESCLLDCNCPCTQWVSDLQIVIREVRNEALEEAAKVAEQLYTRGADQEGDLGLEDIIRALKEPTP